MSVAFDFNGRPDPATLVANGASLTLIYWVNCDYAATLRAAGLAVRFIDETTGTDAALGYSEGVKRAQNVEAWLPAGECPWVVLWDTDANADPDPNAVTDSAAFIKGYCDTTPREFVDVYGPRAIVDAAKAAHPKVRWSWVPETWGADPAKDALIQIANTPSPVPGTDLDTIHADMGGDDLTPDEHAWLQADHVAIFGVSGDGSDPNCLLSMVREMHAQINGLTPAQFPPNGLQNLHDRLVADIKVPSSNSTGFTVTSTVKATT